MTSKKKGNSPVTALVLRTCRDDMSSKNDFVWPGVGEVAKCPDWKANKQCGNGLHGWLYGQGDHGASDYLDAAAKWLVVEVKLEDVIMLGGKCKFPEGTVRFIGDCKSATDYLITNEPNARELAVIGARRNVGDNEITLVGALGTATAGYRGTATAGYRGTATAGESGTATAGNYGTATAGESGTATAGESGTATAGNYGTATAGNYGTATAGNYGTATAGESGELRIRYYDNKSERYRTAVGYVGENGIEANTPYCLDNNHKFVKVDQ